MHQTLPKHAISKKLNAILSINHTLVADSCHRLAVKIISANTKATKAFDNGNRYFSSVVESAEACSVDEPDGEPDLATAVFS